MSRMLLLLILLLVTGVFHVDCASTSLYIPSSWTGICAENVLNSPSSLSMSASSVLVNLQCNIPRSRNILWKLNDLRQWTITNQFNNQTTPTNRTVIYNITITCANGANISLPWPMRVAGLQEIHVSYCRMVDKYQNMHDTIDFTIPDDMKILDIRHSFWIVNQTSDSLMNSTELLNITSRFDCGQDSSLEVSITSNVSDVIMKNLVEANVYDMNMDLKMREAQIEATKFIMKMLNARTKCSYLKLRTIDESMAPLTSKHHFEFMIQGANYPVLENMNYSNIGLTEIPQQLAQWRIYFYKLKHLDISHNYVSTIKIPALPPTANIGLVRFDVRDNNITFISMDILKSWASVESFFVDIRDNPIHCGCELSNLLPYLQDNSTFQGRLAPYEYVKYLRCRTPHSLAGQQLHKLIQSSLPCPEYNTNMAAVIVLSVIMALIIVIIIVVIRFKVEIRILLYTRLHVRLPCDADVQRNNKTFDAFVSYSNDDAVWVHENLIKFLERSETNSLSADIINNNNNKYNANDNNRKTFKLCVHERDFIPGKTIFDNIVDSIEASRHTIIVLSPSFMRSHWAMEELRQAYRQSLVEKTRHLIVILLEKVSKDEMDPLIQRCCKTFTYLEVNDSLFKDRLVFSLTTKDKGAKRRDRLAAKEREVTETYGQNDESSIYNTDEEAKTYDNLAYNSSPGRPPEPTRELSNMSTSSTCVLNPY